VVDPRQTVIVDVDGVLLNWAAGFDLYMTKVAGLPPINVDYPHHRYERYCNTELHEGHDAATLVATLIKSFALSLSFGRLGPHEDSMKVVNELHRNYGVQFIAITSCGNDPDTINLRRQNINNLYGTAVTEIYHVPIGESKEAYLNMLHQPDHPLIYIDDYWRHCTIAQSIGYRTFQMHTTQTGHKMAQSKIPRIYSWQRLRGLWED